MNTSCLNSLEKRNLGQWAKKNKELRSKIRESLLIIRTFLTQHPNAVVSFSGGKDSTVLADLVYRVKHVPCIWSDDEFYLPQTGEYVERCKGVLDIHHIRTNATHAPWFRITGQKWNSINHYAVERLGARAVFIGVRSDESRQRKWRSRVYGPIDHSGEVFGLPSCCPILSWTANDIWAYIVNRNLDYNRAYDDMDAAGIPIDEQRVGPYAPAGAYEFALKNIKQIWPEEFERFAAKYPEARRYV